MPSAVIGYHFERVLARKDARFLPNITIADIKMKPIREHPNVFKYIGKACTESKK